MREIRVQEWLVKFENGEFDSGDVDTMIRAGWYDWFCGDKELRARLLKLAPMVKLVVESEYFDKTLPQYVFFKNNCPVDGKLYDSFSLCAKENGNVQWWISIKTGYKRGPETSVCHVRANNGFENIIKDYAGFLYPSDQLSFNRYLSGGVRTLRNFFSSKDTTGKMRLLGINK